MHSIFRLNSRLNASDLVKQRLDRFTFNFANNEFFQKDTSIVQGILKYWNGSWTNKPVKYWNGSWTSKPVKLWTGLSWIILT